MVKILSMLFLLGCVDEASGYLASSLTACSSEIPDDGLDDTAGVQAAINARCPLSPGVYDIDMAPTPPVGRRRYSMLTVGANGELSGVGAILRFRGNAGVQGLQDWRGVEMTGSSPSVHDIRFETPDLTGTSEQTHAIRITGPSANPSVSNVDFDHPYRGMDGGDCIQAVGYTATLITNLYVGHITGDCDRSAVAMHSGVDGAVVEYVTAFAGDQVVDGEGSGEGSQNWLITHNVFSTRPSDQGTFGLQLQLTDHVRITDNVFDGRGIVVYSGTDIEIDDVDITRRAASGEGAIEIIKEATDVRIHNVRVERTASAGAGAVIRVTPHGTGFASNVMIGPAATLVQRISGNVIDATGVVGLNVDGVTVAYTGPVGQSYAVSMLAAVTRRTGDLHVTDSVFAGPLGAVMRISGSYAGTDDLASRRNIAIGATRGIFCENTANISGPVTSTGDTMPATCAIAVVTP